MRLLETALVLNDEQGSSTRDLSHELKAALDKVTKDLEDQSKEGKRLERENREL
ncbi:hypothetical protein A2U01_0115522, partial [Trifolium medium]|nr:hypothetical protein [Trifolium medium]